MNLNEWKDSNGNKINTPKATATSSASTTTSFKKRFEKLIKYHIDHASSELESITRKDIFNYSFRLSEHYDNGHHEFDRDIIVSVDKNTDEFFISIFIDHKEVDSIQRIGYENFVKAIEPYMFLPDARTPEYNDLLVEWVDKTGKKVSLNKSYPPMPAAQATSTSNKDKFVKLMYNMMKNKLPSVTDVKCVRVDDNGFTYKETRSLTRGEFTLVLLIGYEKDDSWKSELYMDSKLLETKQGTGMADLIRYMGQYFSVPDIGTKEYTELCESAPTSIADDFKLYENLWD